MDELWLWAKMSFCKFYDKTWGRLWTKFLNKVIPFDVSWEKWSKKLENGHIGVSMEIQPSTLRNSVTSAIAGAIAGAVATALLAYLFNPCK